MPIHNSDVARIFSETADMLELKGENVFRIRSYRQAADTVRNLAKNVADMVDLHQDLTEFEGIGPDLAGKIAQIVHTNSLDLLEELKKQIPPELCQLMQIQGLGAKRVWHLYNELNIKTPDELEQAAKAGQIEKIEGFGKKTQQNILEQIEHFKQQVASFLLSRAEELVTPLISYLTNFKGLEKLEIAGSMRRRKETVHDVDILAVCKKDSELMDYFTAFDGVAKILSKGPAKTTVMLKSDLQADLRVFSKSEFGAALVYFTGSKDHNIAIRKIGLEHKYKVNEYGVWKGNQRIAGETEEDVYKSLGLAFIEPELRENIGELKAAKEGKLPRLITAKDIRGDLHFHSTYSDGHNSIREIALAAKDRGYEYIAVTDHSKSTVIAGGLTEDRLLRQIDEIDKINQTLDGIRVLKGAEVDILRDGTLDFSDEILKRLDVRVCSCHANYSLSEQEQTSRILRAMDNRYFNILGHPTGRVINERRGYQVNLERLMKEAKSRRCVFELNSQDNRLDINDANCRLAKEIGVKVAISTDGHRVQYMDLLRYGLSQARRGWLEPGDVVNTMPLAKLIKYFKRD